MPALMKDMTEPELSSPPVLFHSSEGSTMPSQKSRTGRDCPLQVKIAEGVLTIAIGVETLAYAAARAPRFYDYEKHVGDRVSGPYFDITNVDEFAEGIAAALQHEEEDGSGPIHDLLDRMTEAALEDGTLGVDFDSLD